MLQLFYFITTCIYLSTSIFDTVQYSSMYIKDVYRAHKQQHNTQQDDISQTDINGF